MPYEPTRLGNKIEFRIHINKIEEHSLGDIEKRIWSLIRHFISADTADSILKNNHGITNSRSRMAKIKNLKVYIQHAHELYEDAKQSKANTAPLFYYYSFLNLAKGLCEIKFTNFHERKESHRHGIYWESGNDPIINFNSEKLSFASRRGVWQCLLDYLTDRVNHTPGGSNIKIKNLFSFSPELSSEYLSSFEVESRLIPLHNPSIWYDDNNTWVSFSVPKDKLKSFNISKNKFLDFISDSDTGYEEIKSDLETFYKFQTKDDKVREYSRFGNDYLFEALKTDLINLNLSAVLLNKSCLYLIAAQNNLQFKIPQILVIYSLIYWLSSLVRYNPHSMEYIQKSRYWQLVDGLMNESRIWLLELFAWEYYKEQRILLSSR